MVEVIGRDVTDDQFVGHNYVLVVLFKSFTDMKDTDFI